MEVTMLLSEPQRRRVVNVLMYCHNEIQDASEDIVMPEASSYLVSLPVGKNVCSVTVISSSS